MGVDGIPSIMLMAMHTSPSPRWVDRNDSRGLKIVLDSSLSDRNRTSLGDASKGREYSNIMLS